MVLSSKEFLGILTKMCQSLRYLFYGTPILHIHMWGQVRYLIWINELLFFVVRHQDGSISFQWRREHFWLCYISVHKYIWISLLDLFVFLKLRIWLQISIWFLSFTRFLYCEENNLLCWELSDSSSIRLNLETFSFSWYLKKVWGLCLNKHIHVVAH